jgi:hypothetical protein
MLVPGPAPMPRALAQVDYSAWPAKLSEEEFKRLLNTQQNPTTGGSDPQTASVVSYRGSQPRTENPRTTIPLTNEVIPVSTPRGSGSPAALAAGYDFYKEEDQVLIEEGWKPITEMHNSIVEERYGRCFNKHHMLMLFLDPRVRDEIANFVAASQNRPQRSDYGCIKPSSVAKAFSVRCPVCKVIVTEKVQVNRVIAISHKPPERYWKAVIKKRGGGYGSFIYHSSAMCAIFQGNKYCVRHEHIRFETYRHNGMRKSYHSGRFGC